MARAAILLLIVVSIVYSSAFPQEVFDTKCGPHEEFKECGSPCVARCGEVLQPICVMSCSIGCQCKEGFVRNHEDKCVLTRDC